MERYIQRGYDGGSSAPPGSGHPLDPHRQQTLSFCPDCVRVSVTSILAWVLQRGRAGGGSSSPRGATGLRPLPGRRNIAGRERGQGSLAARRGRGVGRPPGDGGVVSAFSLSVGCPTAFGAITAGHQMCARVWNICHINHLSYIGVGHGDRRGGPVERPSPLMAFPTAAASRL